MDGGRFDDLARGFASSTSRRGLLKAALGGLVAGLAGFRPTSAATCRGATDICRKDGDCCSKLCGPTDSTGRRRCICPPGQEPCNRTCVDPTVAYQSDPKNCGSCGVSCPRPSDPCLMAICTQGVCGIGPDPAKVGRACTDGDLCTVSDVCQPDGSCQGTPKACTTNVVCQVAFCDPVTGDCAVAPAADGASCNADNSACTVDTCQSGSCVAGAPKDCSTDPAVNDACNTGVCDPASGQCVKQPKENGTACNADDSLCTENDTCQAGVCTPGTAKTCPASLNQCQINGTCDPTTGECVYQIASSSTACTDGNPFCLDGFCCASVCTVYSDPLDESTGQRICCPSGETCRTVDVPTDSGSLSVGICCAGSGDACFDVSTNQNDPTLVCCPSGTSCRPLGIDPESTSGLPAGICCAGDGCIALEYTNSSPDYSVVCCDAGTTCKPVAPFGSPSLSFTPGLCCPTGADPCVERTYNGSFFELDAVCCPSGETCQSETFGAGQASISLSTCCATEGCPVVPAGSPIQSFNYECCPGGTACSTVSLGVSVVGLCCPEGSQAILSIQGQSASLTCSDPCETELCTQLDLDSGDTSTICCPSATVCAPLPGDFTDVFGEVGLCCAEGVQACVTSKSGLTQTIGCCEGTCHTTSIGVSFCCPAGEIPQVSGLDVTCVPADACPVFTLGEVLLQACPDGTECLTVTGDGIEIGACCPAGQELTLDVGTASTACCEANRVCLADSATIPVCCDADELCVSGVCQPQV